MGLANESNTDLMPKVILFFMSGKEQAVLSILLLLRYFNVPFPLRKVWMGASEVGGE